MLAQDETKSKAPFGNRNGRPDKSNGLDQQFAKLKKELTLAQIEISNLKNQIHQAKENIAKERAEPGTSPPSPPRKGFKIILPTGDNSDSED